MLASRIPRSGMRDWLPGRNVLFAAVFFEHLAVLYGESSIVQVRNVHCARPSPAGRTGVDDDTPCFQRRSGEPFELVVPFATVPRSGTTLLRRVLEEAMQVSTESVYDEGGSCKRNVLEVDLFSECIDNWASLPNTSYVVAFARGESLPEKDCKVVCGCANLPSHGSAFPRYCRADHRSDYVFAKTHFPFLRRTTVWPPLDMLPGSIPGILVTLRHPLTNFDAWRRFRSDPRNEGEDDPISFTSFLDSWLGFIEFWEDFALQKEIPLLIVRYEDLISKTRGNQTFVDLFAAAGLASESDRIEGAVEFVSRTFKQMLVANPIVRCRAGQQTVFGIPAYGNQEVCGPDVTPEEFALLRRGTVAGEVLERFGYGQHPPHDGAEAGLQPHRQNEKEKGANAAQCAVASCDHPVTIQMDRMERFTLCTHDPALDVLSRLFHEDRAYRGLDYMHALCSEGVLVCRSGHLFVDGGAAFGFLALYGAVRGMEVHAVEPLEWNTALLRQAIGVAECELGRRLELDVHELALGDEGGDLALTHVHGSLGATVACASGEHLRQDVEVHVRAASVAAIVGSNTVHFLHLNCQGCEFKVLADLLTSGVVVENVMVVVPPESFDRCSLHHVSMDALRLLQRSGFCLFEMAPVRRGLRLQEHPPTRPIGSLQAWTEGLKRDPVLAENPGWSSFVFASRICDGHLKEAEPNLLCEMDQPAGTTAVH